MKTLGKILLALVLILVVAGLVIYGMGAMLPETHKTTRTGVIPAPPEKVFSLMTDLPNQIHWRKGLQGVQLLPPKDGHPRWREDLGHGQFMLFTATASDPPLRREVLLDDPAASYGGTWTYQLSPTADGNTTLTITEDGFIHPPPYRFLMRYVIGMNSNLDQYLSDIQAAALK